MDIVCFLPLKLHVFELKIEIQVTDLPQVISEPCIFMASISLTFVDDKEKNMHVKC